MMKMKDEGRKQADDKMSFGYAENLIPGLGKYETLINTHDTAIVGKP